MQQTTKMRMKITAPKPTNTKLFSSKGYSDARDRPAETPEAELSMDLADP